jgi:hypothetical protein
VALPTLVVEADWDANGTFDGGVEDITADVERIRIAYGRQGPLGIASPATCEIVLANDDARYSPENVGSPLSPNVKPRRKVRIRTTAPVAKTKFVGRIDTISVEAALDARKANLNCADEMAFLLREQGAIYTLPTGDPVGYLEPDASGIGPLTGDTVIAVLDAAGWPAGGANRVLDVGISELDTYWVAGVDPLSALSALVDEDLGYAYVRGDGAFVFEDRSHRHESDHLTVQATYSDLPSAALHYDDLETYDYNLESIYNLVRAQARPRKSTAGVTIWRLPIPADSAGTPNPPRIPPGGSETFIATWDNPASGTFGSGFTANGNPGGYGPDLTSQVAKVEGTKYVTRWAITLTNNSTQDAYITALAVTARVRQPIDEPSEQVVLDASSQTAYGPREFPHGPQFIGKTQQAKNWANYALIMYKQPTTMLKLGFGPYDDTVLTEMLTRELSDRVFIRNTELFGAGQDKTYFVEGIEHEYVCGESGPKEWRTYLTLSYFDNATVFWNLGTVNRGELGLVTRLFG